MMEGEVLNWYRQYEHMKAERDAARGKLAEAWDEGFDAGHETARAVNPEWPNRTANPYRGGE